MRTTISQRPQKCRGQFGLAVRGGSDDDNFSGRRLQRRRDPEGDALVASLPQRECRPCEDNETHRANASIPELAHTLS